MSITCAADVVQVVTDLQTALDAARQVLGEEMFRLRDVDLTDLVTRSHRVIAQAQGVHLRLVHELTERGVPEAIGAVDTRTWLTHSLRVAPATAGATARLATALHGARCDTGAALAAGELDLEQARVIVGMVDKLPEQADPEVRDWVEGLLLDKARVLHAADLRRLRPALEAAIDPDGIEPAEDLARGKRGATITDNHDGTGTLTWRETDENIALVKAALDKLSAPMPGEDGDPDTRSGAERRADALLDLVTLGVRGGELRNSRGVKPHVHITVPIATLTGTPGAPGAAFSSGEALSAEALRRLICDADLTGIVLNEHGVPLSVGRTHRTVTPGIWAALVARDTGCAFPGCTRPAGWADAHHIQHWSQGGKTALENTVLLCGTHHVSIHHKGWDVRIGRHGHPEFIPPPWIDAARQPRRNEHWAIQRELRQPPDR